MSLLNDVDMLCKETANAVDEGRHYAVKAANELAAQRQAEINLLRKQRDSLLAALEVIATNAEECMHFDELEGMFVPIEDYNRLMDVVGSLKGAE